MSTAKAELEQQALAKLAEEAKALHVCCTHIVSAFPVFFFCMFWYYASLDLTWCMGTKHVSEEICAVLMT